MVGVSNGLQSQQISIKNHEIGIDKCQNKNDN